jgi:cytochrome c oxidase subunit II
LSKNLLIKYNNILMSYLIVFAIIALLVVITIQIGKVSELASRIRGEEEVELANIRKNGIALVAFMFVFLIGCIASAWYYKNQMLGYGPLKSASAHGFEVDSMFNVTLVLTGIVFIITHILLFWYSYKYHQKTGAKATFFAHDTKLELIWTGVPAVVMAFLVAKGLIAWNRIMPDVNPNDEYIEIEATGYQFAWDIRYPGEDGILGTKDFRLIDPANNALGMDWSDMKTHDDIILTGSDRIVLPVNKKVRVQITARDVLHNFYLPHFRVKMDAVPGLPTYFIFTPVKTTAEFRQQLRQYPEWNEPFDPSDPDSKKRWEMFDFELACAELCGTGHYSMKRIVEIVSEQEYEDWLNNQTAFYSTNVKGTDTDPFKDSNKTEEKLMDDNSEEAQEEAGDESENALSSIQ